MPIDSLLDLHDEVAIVTGAGAGIGCGIAQRLAEAGAAVAVSDLDGGAAQSAAAAIARAGGTAISTACNVTSEEDRAALIATAVQALGAPTILINNAGGGGPKPFDMPLEQFVWAYQLNVFAGFRMCQLVAPHMQDNGHGAVVNISSMAGENRNHGMTSYSSSKAAVNHLTRNMAFDLGPMGIRVNAIAPGAIRTHALSTVLTPDIERQMLKHTPLGRLGEPEDIANACLFLVAPISSWVSGQVLTVSGGGDQELE
jgi:7-alpha-hydroxysteroid dehydrogenase